MDGIAIEPHLVEVTTGFFLDGFIVKCAIEKPREVTYYSGYRYHKGAVEKSGNSYRVKSFTKDISIERLIKHLTMINSKRKVRAIEKVINDVELLKALQKRQTEVPALISFLQKDEFMALNEQRVTKAISLLKSLLKH